MSYTGDCNLCGRCCEITVNHIERGATVFRCSNLGVFDQIGIAGATLCMVWDKRWQGMPIVMVSEDGKIAFHSRCMMTYPRDTDAIPPECSYQWDSKEPQPKWHLGYAPGMERPPFEKSLVQIQSRSSQEMTATGSGL